MILVPFDVNDDSIIFDDKGSSYDDVNIERDSSSERRR